MFGVSAYDPENCWTCEKTRVPSLSCKIGRSVRLERRDPGGARMRWHEDGGVGSRGRIPPTVRPCYTEQEYRTVDVRRTRPAVLPRLQ
ncbi:hypothetical protein BHE74_00013779 [Ensete ventricosum]|nr:hypothetical protein GW17_00035562 [Ensete ventricosum]RWW78020.1 hypothetical protein BHE74_00013779 [Ensete ventricosum]